MAFAAQSSVYQFVKNAKLPIFMEFTAPEFGPGLPKFLVEMGWSVLNEQERKEAELTMANNSLARSCSLVPAYGAMHDRLGLVLPEDKWGKESLEPGHLGSIYRYKGVALAAYGPHKRVWEMAVKYEFGTGDYKIPSQVVVVRYLSWALSAQGIVGLWGQVQENGIVIARERDLAGKAIFIDMARRKYFTGEGEKIFPHYPSFLRPTSLIREDGQRLSREELFAALLSHSTLFDFDPMPSHLQRSFALLARESQGSKVLREKIPGITPLVI